jgi:L-threonylcarbamoyladenylate synthase
MTRHYATRTPLVIYSENEERLLPGEKTGLLSFTAPKKRGGYQALEILSASGSLTEAAANLFSALRRLDNGSLDRIIARPVPETGLGAAIMDRLRRCSAMQ